MSLAKPLAVVALLLLAVEVADVAIFNQHQAPDSSTTPSLLSFSFEI